LKRQNAFEAGIILEIMNKDFLRMIQFLPLKQNRTMNKIYYLSTCSTSARIIKELGITPKKFVMQDIKTETITPEQLDEMKEKAGSYEALFSRIALKFRAWGLNEKKLTETDYRKYILEEYTFLKRPVILAKGKIFVGNSKKNVEAAKAAIS
jgi:arsenate reductase (glutaredoxin)